jgi:DNA-binding transcriptional ArsR family regulator
MIKEQDVQYIQSTLCQIDDTFWQLFKALGDCARYRMVKVMMHYRKMSVTDLAHIVGISVPATSQHLRVLEKTGLLTKKRVGKTIYYELIEDDQYVSKVVDLIETWLKRDEEK